ncbi:MAG: patatin-like phospholipase family protein, partial [Prosthecobacter sp.]|nr:patatin-like phospholipase family protein [Prosthecobacter sp.]
MTLPNDAVPAPTATPGAKKPDRHCDMVMKGGITSGVVYPLAIHRLSEEFIFKNIGGTSAGAIAAAAAAVAEATRGTPSGGFEKLKDLPAFLQGAAPDIAGSNLLAFFQPQPRCRRLFRLGTVALGERETLWQTLKIATGVVRLYWLPFLLGVLPAALFLAAACCGADGGFWWACLAAAAVLGLIGAVAAIAVTLSREISGPLPENFYGLCSGMTDDFRDVSGGVPAKRGKPLTYWLHEYLNSYLGRGPTDVPVTFGDLWGPEPQLQPDGEPGTEPEEKKVNLEMMTTCLTYGRPYRLPFRNDDDLKENVFFFNECEFRQLFPA